MSGVIDDLLIRVLSSQDLPDMSNYCDDEFFEIYEEVIAKKDDTNDHFKSVVSHIRCIYNQKCAEEAQKASKEQIIRYTILAFIKENIKYILKRPENIQELIYYVETYSSKGLSFTVYGFGERYRIGHGTITEKGLETTIFINNKDRKVIAKWDEINSLLFTPSMDTTIRKAQHIIDNLPNKLIDYRPGDIITYDIWMSDQYYRIIDINKKEEYYLLEYLSVSPSVSIKVGNRSFYPNAKLVKIEENEIQKRMLPDILVDKVDLTLCTDQELYQRRVEFGKLWDRGNFAWVFKDQILRAFWDENRREIKIREEKKSSELTKEEVTESYIKRIAERYLETKADLNESEIVKILRRDKINSGGTFSVDNYMVGFVNHNKNGALIVLNDKREMLLTYRELANEIILYCKKRGATNFVSKSKVRKKKYKSLKLKRSESIPLIDETVPQNICKIEFLLEDDDQYSLRLIS